MFSGLEQVLFLLQDDDDDIVNSWTLRKCSAAGLDIMSSFFGDEMLPVLMPKLQVRSSLSAMIYAISQLDFQKMDAIL